jgi:SAM-dependent methyltransferase
MEDKLYDERQEWLCNEDWQSSWPAAHHIDENKHCLRLLVVKSLVEFSYKFLCVRSVTDIGCGDGGLLDHLRRLDLRDLELCGYDYSRPCIEYAVSERKLAGVVSHLNFEKNMSMIKNSDCYVCSEVLEHLEFPRDFLKTIRDTKIFKVFVASSPVLEKRGGHYIHHYWAWDDAGYRGMFEDIGYRVLKSIIVDGFQVLLCSNGKDAEL